MATVKCQPEGILQSWWLTYKLVLDPNLGMKPKPAVRGDTKRCRTCPPSWARWRVFLSRMVSHLSDHSIALTDCSQAPLSSLATSSIHLIVPLQMRDRCRWVTVPTHTYHRRLTNNTMNMAILMVSLHLLLPITIICLTNRSMLLNTLPGTILKEVNPPLLNSNTTLGIHRAPPTQLRPFHKQ